MVLFSDSEDVAETVPLSLLQELMLLWNGGTGMAGFYIVLKFIDYYLLILNLY